MNKQEISQLIADHYQEKVNKANAWFQDWIDNSEESKRPSAGANYIKKTVGLLVAAEEVLSGEYKDEAFRPEAGSYFNPSAIKTMQEIYIDVHYRIALVNREAHRILNNINPEDTPFDEVIDMIESKNQGEWLVPGFWPQYLTDLNIHKP